MEDEPCLRINMNGEAMECRRNNTSLFTFLGELAIYDHIFVVYNEEENYGAYLFKNQEVWSEMAGFLFEHMYPMHLNLPEVAQCDRDAFDATMFTDLRSQDTFPADWE